jgi:hypothetical protein
VDGRKPTPIHVEQHRAHELALISPTVATPGVTVTVTDIVAAA